MNKKNNNYKQNDKKFEMPMIKVIKKEKCDITSPNQINHCGQGVNCWDCCTVS